MNNEGITIEKIRCSNCKVFRQPDTFIGKLGVTVRRCNKCREKDARQKKRPDVIEKRKEMQKLKKYYVGHRQKKRDNNEEEFLRHNAETAKAWRERNTEHLANWRTNNVNTRLSAIQQQARKKGIPWDVKMTKSVCEVMMTNNCFYCGYLSPETLNGIDRMDNARAYTFDNCVSCCKNCNFIKKCLDPVTYVQRCHDISLTVKGESTQFLSAWKNSKSVDLTTYKKRALSKQLCFELSDEQFFKLQSGSCEYCGRVNTDHHINGVDRRVDGVGYTQANCVTCCGECNQMKCGLNDEEFKNHCAKVSTFQTIENVTLPDNIPVCLRVVSKRQIILPETSVVTNTLPDNTKIQRVNFRKEKLKNPDDDDEVDTSQPRTSNLPETADKIVLPKYCYYVPETDAKGDGFTCGRLHPNQKASGKDWTTSKKRSLTTQQKFQELMAYVNQVPYEQPIIEKQQPPPKKPSCIDVDKKMGLLCEESLVTIMQMKQQNKTTEDVSKQLKLEFDIIIPRNIISQIWNGKIDLPPTVKATKAYLEMMANSKLRTVRATKFTEEEIKYIKECDSAMSLLQITKAFESKYNKTMTKTYVSKLRSISARN